MIKINFNKITIILFTILALIFIPLLSYHTILSIYATTDNQQQTIDYVQSKTANLELNYTSTEASHLEDVKKVMTNLDLVFYLSLLLAIGLVIYAFKQKTLAEMLYYAGITLVSAIGITLLLAILSFNGLFTLFHQIFFPQGNWQFPADSLLIQTFPLQFFISISILIFILTIIMGILFIVAKKPLQTWISARK